MLETPETSIVHACPPGGYGLMPCCQRPLFEVPSERITDDPARVTCAGLPVETPETGMRLEDVPAALVDEFERRLERAIGGRVPNEPTREDIAVALAGVLPVDRTAERAKVAEEARAYAEGHLPAVRAVLYAFSNRITTRREQT